MASSAKAEEVDTCKQSNVAQSQGEKKETKNEYSYQMYPGRRGETLEISWFRKHLLNEGRSAADNLRCQKHVCDVVERSPIVKLMISALHSAGCDFDIGRHVSCEECSTAVSGGYDTTTNQIVICQNVSRSVGRVQGALSHELIHMFDYCRAKVDFKNIDHLACSEIRAANIMHCSFLGAVFDGTASPFHIAKQHAECVKFRALMSVMSVRDISKQEAMQAVEKVFTKCYNDLEPVGRRIRRKSQDMERAYRERYIYGYFDP